MKETVQKYGVLALLFAMAVVGVFINRGIERRTVA
jgi:hypothetical protein